MSRTGKHVWTAAGWTALFLFLSAPLAAQQGPEGLSVKAGVGMEYLNRTVSWDENAFTSGLKGILLAFQAEVEARPGLSACFQAGYALSDFGGLVFRGLPFSVEYQAGATGGLLLGAGIKARASASPSFDIEIAASFDACFGFPGEWALEGLAVEGSLDGRSSWMRIAAGPVVWYKGLSYYVYPFVRVQYTALWGSFRMTETVASLGGTEKKAVSGRGLVAVSLGALSEITEAIGLKAEVTAIPRSGGLDIGASGRVVFSF
ncbi:MAG: hypothetical protein JW747_02860 [Candidatus Aminicenantes bacterium]|nr:hypothetical protein [Candidatus Aminicenantes bacterium]